MVEANKDDGRSDLIDECDLRSCNTPWCQHNRLQLFSLEALAAADGGKDYLR